MWEPNLKDVKDITNSGGLLLSKAKWEYEQRLKTKLTVNVKDSLGKQVAYENDTDIVVAKKYIHGNLVSCHKGLLERARTQHKRLVMYIGDDDQFYYFEPNDVLSNGEDNYRGTIDMWNFKIWFGKNAETEANFKISDEKIQTTLTAFNE